VLLRLVIAGILMAVIAPLLSVGVNAQPVPGNSPAHRLNIVPTAEEIQQFHKEELKKKQEAFRKTLLTEFGQGRPQDAEKTVIYVNQKKTWFGAEKHCQAAYGSNLVSVSSAAFNTSLGHAVKTMSSNPQTRVWIGLRRPAAYFIWSDTTPYYFQNWRFFTPWKKDKWKNCVSARGVRDHRGGAKFNWVTEDCWEKRSFACWKKDKKPTKFTVASVPVKPRKPETLIPDCPLLKSQRVTAIEARRWCTANAQCTGYRVHSVYTQMKLADKPSYVRFYQDGTECAQTRLDRAKRQNFVFIQKDK
jgi:hypothetical protein